MNTGDALAAGAKSEKYTTGGKNKTREEWAAMFEPEPAEQEVHKEIEKFGEMLDAIGQE